MGDHALLLKASFGGEWRQHPLHPLYWFSNEGLAASVKQRPGKLSCRLLLGCKSGQQGYRAISPALGNGKFGRIYIHRAVCELFHGAPPAPKMHARHLDCNLLNNRAENLAWGTALDNARDGIRNGRVLKGEANPMAKLTQQQVDEMRRIRKETGEFYHVIAEMFGVSRMTAHRAITGALWT